MKEPKLTKDGQFMANVGFSVLVLLALLNLYEEYGEDIKNEVLTLLGKK